MHNLKKYSSAIAAVALGTALALSYTGPAAAAGKVAGKTCSVSGMVKASKGNMYVCTKTANGKATWSAAVKTKKGKPTLTVSNGWAKAANTSDGAMMSAAFGMVNNTGSSPVRIIAASSPYAKAVQLHEVVMKDGAMVMQEKSGGFLVAANGMLELKPGGNHLMFIGLKKSIVAGTSIPVTLYTSDGKKLKVSALGKEFSGANEEYPGDHGGGM